MDFFNSIIAGVIASGLPILYLVFAKSLIRNWINKPFEEELREFSSNLDKVREQVNFKFTIYHQKKFETLSESYYHINNTILYLNSLTSELFANKTILEAYWKKSGEELKIAKTTLGGGAIFINDELLEKIQSVVNDLSMAHTLSAGFIAEGVNELKDIRGEIQKGKDKMIDLKLLIKREIEHDISKY